MEMDASDHAFARPRRRRHRSRRHDDEVRLAEIMALQQSLAAMEDFFQSLLGQANFYMEALDPQNGGGGPPPISKHALDALPTLADGSQILCGICGEEGCETRLPCGHAYHRGTCVEPWLIRHCTCPVCRYELPTDDESYEPGRVERMASRKIQECDVKEVPSTNDCFLNNRDSDVHKLEEYESDCNSEEIYEREDQRHQEEGITERSIEHID